MGRPSLRARKTAMPGTFGALCSRNFILALCMHVCSDTDNGDDDDVEAVASVVMIVVVVVVAVDVELL